MGVLSNITNRIANAFQPSTNGRVVDNFFSRDPFKLLELDKNFNGKYDNYYPNANRIVQVASQYPIYLVDEDNGVSESPFAEVLKNPNQSFPRRKVYEQIYTELITHGESNIFIWHKQGKDESSHYEPGKAKLAPEKFTGITLVSGYDTSKLTPQDKKDIVKITYGVNQRNVFLGYSPTQAANAWRKMQDAMGSHSTSFAANSGMPMGTFIITAKNEEQYLGVKKELAKRTVGAKNAGKVLFSYKPSTSQEAQIQWVKFTSDEAQNYTEQLDYTDKKIDQSFGVPGVVKGTNDEANYATASVSKAVFIEFTIKPLVDSLAEQLDFYLKQRFQLEGEVKADVEIPTVADEVHVEAQATEVQIRLFDAKIAEGWTAESIVAAYNLPKRFLLLETSSGKAITSNNAKKRKISNTAKKKDELVRRYMNQLSKREMDTLEKSVREIVNQYATVVLSDGIKEANRLAFEADMAENYGSQYNTLYKKAAVTLTDDLLELFDSIDVSVLDLTDEELTAAISKYSERVAAFSQTFTDNVASLEGDTLEVRQRAAKPHVDRVVVTESEHTRAESELDVYVKGQKEFDVKIFKTWQTQGDANVCPECLALENEQIEVTGLFNSTNEDNVFETTAGLAHPNCVAADTKVIAPGAKTIMSTHYKGKMIQLSTSTGSVTVTKNHVFLTDRGWVTAQHLTNTDKILRYSSPVESALVEPDDDNTVSSIKEIFTLASKQPTVSRTSVPASTEHLHGDAIENNKIDIVDINSLVENVTDTSVVKSLSDQHLSTAHLGYSLNGDSSLSNALLTLSAASDGLVSSDGISDVLLSSSTDHHETVRSSVVSDYDSRLGKASSNDGSTDVEALTNGIDALSSIISLDEIVNVTEVDYDGHVYDLSTDSTAYLCNDYITSNCRCFVEYKTEKS